MKAGAEGWGWNDVLPYFLRAENNERGASEFHAVGGPLNVADQRSPRSLNQELIAADRLMENLPAIVEAAARGLAGANLTVLNGTEGVSEVVAGLVGQGISIFELLKNAAANGNGTGPSAVTGQVTEGKEPAGVN